VVGSRICSGGTRSGRDACGADGGRDRPAGPALDAAATPL